MVRRGGTGYDRIRTGVKVMQGKERFLNRAREKYNEFQQQGRVDEKV